MFWFDVFGWQLIEDHALNMVYTIQKAIAYDNSESPQIIQRKIKLCEERTISPKVSIP